MEVAGTAGNSHVQQVCKGCVLSPKFLVSFQMGFMTLCIVVLPWRDSAKVQ